MASIFIDGMKNKPVPALSSSTAKLSKAANSTKTSPSKIMSKTNKTLRNKPGNLIHKEIAAENQNHQSQSSESDEELPEIENKSYKLLNKIALKIDKMGEKIKRIERRRAGRRNK